MKFSFTKPTLTFAIIGLFISGFTAIGLLGLQMLLSACGIECSNAWKIIWTISIILALILPYSFYRYITTKEISSLQSLKTKLNFFNFFEYIFIQSSLTGFLTKGQTLCYSSDGQNGLEMVFTAWLSLPFLIVFSIILDRTIKLTQEND